MTEELRGFKLRSSAHGAVGKAIKSGQLPKQKSLPCFDCGRQAEQYDHYLGYAEEHWLSVQAVCIDCHGKRTRAENDRIRTGLSAPRAMGGVMRNARKIREDLGMSIIDVVRKTPLDVGQLSRFETGQRWLMEPQIMALVAVYGCTLADLIRAEESEAT